MGLKIQFIGATGTVTGSKYLLTHRDKNYLVDCGLFQGLKDLRLKNWEPLPVDPKNIEAVLLTHAHLDHSGYLPVILKNGFRGKIYSTAATHALCGVLLPDSGYLQEEDAEFANKHLFSKHHPALPLYTEADGRASLRYFETVGWNQKISLPGGLSFLYRPAGHILGAGIIQIFADGVTVTFSGDLGRQKVLTIDPPSPISKTDYLIVESTYGDKCHPKEDPKETLKKLIVETNEKKSVLLIPAFAVGRSQQLLHILSEIKKENHIFIPAVYVNSPMATEATRIFCSFEAEHALTAEQCREMMAGAKFTASVEESKQLNNLKGPAIIIAGSGMATGGRVLHHLKYLAHDPKNIIGFVGFQAAGTRGEAMLAGAKTVKIHGEEIPVRAKVVLIDTLSAHADQEETLTWLKTFSKAPKNTFITHGEKRASEALQKKIEEELHWRCKVPEYLETQILSS